MARAVRISRAPSSSAEPVAASTGFRRNTGGMTRAVRLFVIYLILLALIYGIFVAALATSRAGLGGIPATAPALLSALAVVLGVWGFLITLARTPRGVELRANGFVLTEFFGARRTFDTRGAYDFHVENRYSAGWLSPGPTEMVRLGLPGRAPRRYLVDLRLIPEPAGAEEVGSLQ